MSQTILTGSASYCTAAELVIRADTRVLGDWLADDGTRLTSAQVLASATLAALLKAASGEVESAAVAASRYTPTDLAALTGNTAEFLKDIVAGLTLGRLWARRPRTAAEPFPAVAQWARQELEQLRQGLHIFGTVEAAEAGVMDHDVMTQADIESRRLTPIIARRFFGPRGPELNAAR